MDIQHNSNTFYPLLGTIKAGFPTFVEEENDLISLEQYLSDNIHASFMIKIKNDNLSSIAILKGDLAVIERRATVNKDEIVLILTQGRHIFATADMLQGKMSLTSFDNTLIADSVQVIGVIKGIIRKY